MSQHVRGKYPDIEWRGIHTMRNTLQDDYGHTDREIVWNSVEHDFPELGAFSVAYCKDGGVEL